MPWDQVGRLTRDEGATQLHVDRVLDALRDAGLSADPSLLGEGLKVAVDCVNGSGVQGATMLLEGAARPEHAGYYEAEVGSLFHDRNIEVRLDAGGTARAAGGTRGGTR